MKEESSNDGWTFERLGSGAAAQDAWDTWAGVFAQPDPRLASENIMAEAQTRKDAVAAAVDDLMVKGFSKAGASRRQRPAIITEVAAMKLLDGRRDDEAWRMRNLARHISDHSKVASDAWIELDQLQQRLIDFIHTIMTLQGESVKTHPPFFKQCGALNPRLHGWNQAPPDLGGK